MKSKYRFRAPTLKSKFEHSKYIEQPIEGFKGRVDGKLGEKYMIIEKRQRP
jgi:hypothetical protein